MSAVSKEYLRRNKEVCKAVGAHAGALNAYHRLKMAKRPSKWLLDALRGIIERVETLPPELAAYRDQAGKQAGNHKEPA